MLTARNLPRACPSCRSQLLNLFEHGFTISPSRKASLPAARYASQALPSAHCRRIERARYAAVRSFSTSRSQPQISQTAASTIDEQSSPIDDQPLEIEAFVRRARRTFGETLPKDYLSAEEYLLYERLYGPPVRETVAEDLEYVAGEEEGVGEDVVRNVLLRENEQGEFEEIEFDNRGEFDVMEGEESQEADNGEQTVGEQGWEGKGQEDLEIEDAESVSGEVEEHTELLADAVPIRSQNEREIAAIRKLQQEMAARPPIDPEEDVEEEVEEEQEDYEEQETLEENFEEDEMYSSSDSVRTHPHTLSGRFGTIPSTLSLPVPQLIEPITELLERTKMKHLKETAERVFGGKGLPFSVSTPASKTHLPQKNIGLDASQHRMTEIEADAYIAAVAPGTYVTVMSTLVEVRKRLGKSWLRDLIFRHSGEGPRVLDAGAAGMGAIAWREMIQAEWDLLSDEGAVEGPLPTGKTSVLTASDTLRHRISRFLDDTTFLPRLPDYIHASNPEKLLHGAPAQGRKSYDIIIAPNTLFPLKEDFRRKNMVQNLWSLLDPHGGVLILIEKGMPRGFEAIAGARSLLLDSHISSPGDLPPTPETLSHDALPPPKEPGMIIAPCTNHVKCPMYPIAGLSSGRKDFCHFEQRYTRPEFLQRVLGASMRNHEDVKFSYLAVRRGIDARMAANAVHQGAKASEVSFAGYENIDLPKDDPNPTEIRDEKEVAAPHLKFHPQSLPRAILPPLKRRGHVTLDLCTPEGRLERWTVPKSFSRVAYRDARKSQWGDLWALGAKTRVERRVRLGRLSGEEGGEIGGVEGKGKGRKIKGIRDGRMGKGGKKVMKGVVNEDVEKAMTAKKGKRYLLPEKRTKGGRVWKEQRFVEQDEF